MRTSTSVLLIVWIVLWAPPAFSTNGITDDLEKKVFIVAEKAIEDVSDRLSESLETLETLDSTYASRAEKIKDCARQWMQSIGTIETDDYRRQTRRAMLRLESRFLPPRANLSPPSIDVDIRPPAHHLFEKSETYKTIMPVLFLIAGIIAAAYLLSNLLSNR